MIDFAEGTDIQTGGAATIPVDRFPCAIIMDDFTQHFGSAAITYASSVHNQEKERVACLVTAISGTRVQFVPEIGLLHPATIDNKGIVVATDTLREILFLSIDSERQFQCKGVAYVEGIEHRLHGTMAGENRLACRDRH